MAQRNPMNERYQGDGPAGKTRKSAASAKPKSEAAASVYIEKKPETAKERKAAQKRREAEKRRKDEERARRVREKEKAARIAAGLEPVKEEKKKGFLDALIPSRPQTGQDKPETKVDAAASTTGASTGATGAKAGATGAKAGTATSGAGAKAGTTTGAKAGTAGAKAGTATSGAGAKAGTATKSMSATPTKAADTSAQPEKTGLFNKPPNPNYPQTAQYKQLRKIYWALLLGALGIIVISFLAQVWGIFPDFSWTGVLGLAYACAIGGVILDIAKIRPMVKKHQTDYLTGKKSPKQIKHETEAAAYARELEAAREAERVAKKGTRRSSFTKQPRVTEAAEAKSTGTKASRLIALEDEAEAQPDGVETTREDS